MYWCAAEGSELMGLKLFLVRVFSSPFSYGSMNPSIASVLSVFFPPLLPHGSVDLETSVLMQTASMMSLGILYMNSGNRFIAETLLKQIGKRTIPQPV